jgi:transcription factor SPN1
LFADSEDDEPAKKKPLSKRERMDALQKKKRQDAEVSEKKKKASKRIDAGPAAEGGDEKKDKGYESGDSYASATFERTKEDDDFIDRDDDDEDAIKELYSEQRFNDERPDDSDDEEGGRKKKNKSSSGPRRRGPDALSDDDEEGADANPIMAVVKKMKKKKRVAKKQTELEDEAKEFISKMENAADDDEQAFKTKRPATKKLMQLGDVVDMLTRRDMIRLLLDMDVLASCKRWIQPLPNGTLGNVTVRQRIIECIGNMTGEQGIHSNDLKRSGIGQIIMRLYKHKSETPNMKRAHKKLIEQWSRPIFQKSGNMKDLQHAQSTRGPPKGISSLSVLQSPKAASAAPKEAKQDIQSLIASGKMGNQKEGTNRVRVPYSNGFQFTVRPQSKTGNVADKRMVRPGQPKDNRGNLSKRMIEKGRVAGKNQRSANLSIEGRQTK